MLPRLFIIIFLQFSIISCIAGTIIGKVVTIDHQPISGANIILLLEDSSTLAKADISVADGSFALTASPGNYLLKATAIGYAGYTSEIIKVSSADISLPEIVLAVSASGLKEVTISAQKPLIEIKSDKLVVNVENSIVNTGSSVFEVLGRSPGIVIDQSDNINLKGRPGVTVMMNGKITPVQGTDLANILKSMPSSAIEKIEIISNPGARYDAAGSGGIINIVSKKDKRRGLNGTMSMSYGQGVYSKANGNMNLYYGGRKLTVNLNYGHSDRNSFNELTIIRKFYSNEILKTQYTQLNHTFYPTRNHLGAFAMDYNISSKTTAGASVSGYRSRFNPHANNSSRVDSNGIYNYFTTENRSNDAWNNYSVNGYIKHTFDSTGRQLSADVDYARYWNQTYQLYTNKYFDHNHQPFMPDYLLYGDLSGLTQIRSLKMDYTHPLKNNFKIEAGIKSSYVTADNKPLFFDRTSGTAVPDTSKSNHFIYTENINAAYINVNGDVPKWSFQLGLRAEQTVANGNQVITGDKFTRQYTQLFPSFAVQRHVNKDNDLGITLSRRIDRPGYNQLNPFKYFLDPTNYRTGNPYLNPTLAYSAELSHTFKQRFITRLTASVDHNVITETLEADAVYPNISRQTDKNLARMYFYGIGFAYPITITKWWTSTINSDAYYSYYSGNLSNTTLAKGRPVLNISTTNSFIFPKGLSAELSMNFQSAMVWGFYDMLPYGSVNLGVQKSLMRKKATIKAGFTDIFLTSTSGATIVFNNFSETWSAIRDTRVGNITLIYRIGKSSGFKKHGGGAEDEQRRVGGAG